MKTYSTLINGGCRLYCLNILVVRDNITEAKHADVPILTWYELRHYQCMDKINEWCHRMALR